MLQNLCLLIFEFLSFSVALNPTLPITVSDLCPFGITMMKTRFPSINFTNTYSNYSHIVLNTHDGDVLFYKIVIMRSSNLGTPQGTIQGLVTAMAGKGRAPVYCAAVRGLSSPTRSSPDS